MSPRRDLSWLGALVLAAFFLAASAYISSKRLLWFDELYTIRTVKLPNLGTVWQVQNHSWWADSAPITYCVLVRLVYSLAGGAGISIRLLSAVAMIAAMLVVFDSARRLKGGTCGLLAMCVLGTSFLPHYGYEGRPYALVVLFTAVALWLWLHSSEQSTPAAAAFGISTFIVVTVHFNGVLALVPFGLWELWRWRPCQMPSKKLLGGIVGLLGALVVCAPQMKNLAAFGASGSWCPPSAGALAVAYGHIFPSGMLMLAAFIALVCFTGQEVKWMDEAERFCWLFLVIPVAGYILAKVATNNFTSRYFIATLPGVAVAFACFVARSLARRAFAAFLIFVGALAVGREIGLVRTAESISPATAPDQQTHTRQALAAEGTIVADGKRVVVADVLLADEARYYSRKPELYVMYQRDDEQHIFCKQFVSTCRSLRELKTSAQEVAAIFPSNRLLGDMRSVGLVPTVRMSNPTIVYFSPAN